MNKNELKYIIGAIKPYIALEIVGLFIVLVATFLSLLNPYIMKQIIDVSIMNGDLNSLYKYICFFIIVFFITQFLSIIKSYIFTYIGEKLLYDLRMNLYKSVIRKKIFFLNNTQIGELMARILEEIPLIVNLFAGTLISIIIYLSTFIMVLIIMLSINVYITLAALALLPVLFLIFKHFNPKLKKINLELAQGYADISNITQINFTNIKLIKYMRAYKYAQDILSKKLNKFIKLKYKYLRINSELNFIVSFIYFIPPTVVLLYGGHLVISKLLTIGSILALSSYVSKLIDPMRELSSINVELQKSIIAYRRYLEIIDVEENIKDGEMMKVSLNNGIHINNLFFQYSDSLHVFEDLSLDIPIGSIVHLKGNNGSGKSTLINILCGIINPDVGTINFDNINVSEIKSDCISSIIGIMSQDIYLFNDTVINNIKLGREIEDNIVRELCEDLGIDNEFNNEHLNFETIISNSGTNISGGQAQKISVLRALVHKPQILILDEPSTFLDEHSKINLYNYLMKNINDSILLLVSHEDLDYMNPNITLEIIGPGLVNIKHKV